MKLMKVMKKYTNQPRKPQMTITKSSETDKIVKKYGTTPKPRPQLRAKQAISGMMIPEKDDKTLIRKAYLTSDLNLRQLNKYPVRGSVYYEGDTQKSQTKRPDPRFPFVSLDQKTKQKIKTIGGNVSLDLKPLRLSAFGQTRTIKGSAKGTASIGKVPIDTYQNVWKQIENDIGGAIGYQIDENNRVSLQANKKFFQGQKGSTNSVNLNYNVQDLGGGELNVSLTGTDPFTGKKTKAMNLQYNLRF